MQRVRSTICSIALLAASSALLHAGSAPAADGTPVPNAQAPIVVGIDAGGGPYMTVFDQRGNVRSGFLPYFDFSQGGINVATGDVDGDGRADIVTVPGAGGRGEVRTFGASGEREDRTVLATSSGCGTRIAAGDVNGDGKADLITGLDSCAPNIEVFDGATGKRLSFFEAFNDPSGRPHGIRVAAGDVTGDGRAEIITGAGPGDGSTVRIFSATPSDGFFPTPLRTFDAFGPNVSGGVEVAAADVTGDRHADVIAAAETPDDAQVKIFDGVTGAVVDSFSPFGLVTGGTLRVAAGDLTGDGVPEIAVSATVDYSPTLRVFSADGTLLGELFPPVYNARSLAIGDVGGNGKAELVMGAGPSYDSSVVAFDLAGTVSTWFEAYGYSFTNGVRVASGDLDGNGTLEYVSGQGPGGESELVVLDEAGDVLHDVYPFGETGVGLYVACGDVDGNARADIVVAAEYGEPRVKVLDGEGRERSSFLAFDPGDQGGVRVATGDVNGDGRAEIVAGTGPGNPPVVRVFGASGQREESFYAFDPSYTGGIYVAAGDVTGDGKAEIVVGSGTTGEVRVFTADGRLLQDFTAYPASQDYVGGVRVAVGDVNGDGVAEIVTGPGRVRPVDVEIFTGEGDMIGTIRTNTEFGGGIYVAVPAPLGPPLQRATAVPLRGQEGHPLRLLASFFDPTGGTHPETFGATIDWGDGEHSATAVAALGGGQYVSAQTHRYVDPGRYTVTVRFADTALRAATVSTTATIRDARLIARGRSTRSGPSFHGLVATIRDEDPFGLGTDLRARIDWGDGRSSAGSVVGVGRSFGVVGLHRYRRPGSYRVLVRVRSTAGSSARATSRIRVAG